jgi:hypothetical protein
MTFGERSWLPGGRLTQKRQLSGAIDKVCVAALSLSAGYLVILWVDYHPDSAKRVRVQFVTLTPAQPILLPTSA